jgi:single-strand DNA-binding protein
MLNQAVLVGRLVNGGEKVERDGKSYTKITIATQRSYRNEDAIYETDFIDVILWGPIADNTLEYCKKGDLIGIKGRIQTEGNSTGEKDMQLVADKVTFLSSKKPEGEDE